MAGIKKFIDNLLFEGEGNQAPQQSIETTPNINPSEQWKLASSVNKADIPGIVSNQPGPNLDTVKVQNIAVEPEQKPVAMPVQDPNGVWDFSSVFYQAQLVSPPFTAEQAASIIGTVPRDQGVAVRKKTLWATFTALGQTLGVTPDQIAADAEMKIATIRAFDQELDAKYDEYSKQADALIAGLHERIKNAEAGKALALEKRSQLRSACHAQIDILDDVTEFFTASEEPKAV